MKYLFITKEFPPTPDPSGRIVWNLAKELRQQGHEVDVIARSDKFFEEKKEEGSIFWIKISAWEKISKIVRSGNANKFERLLYIVAMYLRKVFLVFSIKRFPDSEPSITGRIVNLYKKRLSKKRYEYIVCFFRPYSCFSAAMQIKKYDPNIKILACYFDLIEDKDCPKFMPFNLYKRLIDKGDERIFSEAEYVMLPFSAQNSDNRVFKKYADKIVYYEFPTFIEQKSVERNINNLSENSNVIKLVFAGTLAAEFRNPRKLLCLLNEVAKRVDKKIKVDFFGGGDCIQMITSFKTHNNLELCHHGKVPKEEVTTYEKKADILINIMNAYASIVPSKIFELFATGKPILNVMSEGNDGSLAYFDRYPIVYTVQWDGKEPIEKYLSDIETFLVESKNKTANLEDIKKLYRTCTPKYVANQIVEVTNKA